MNQQAFVYKWRRTLNGAQVDELMDDIKILHREHGEDIVEPVGIQGGEYIIHAFDPGETTGFTVCNVVSKELKILVACELFDWDDFALWESRWLSKYRPTVVVVESFRLFQQHAHDQIGSYFPAVERIGAIKYLCSQQLIPIVEQPAACKSELGDDQLFQLFPESVGYKSPHIKDALRHALYYHLSKTYVTHSRKKP
jgi:hypothetical protein